jgi:uncharacterized protein YjhX (UPF0386 family)
MKSIKLLLISVITLVFVFSVNYSTGQGVKLGKIDKKWLEMTTYELDSSANAVIIDDYGRIYYDFSGGDINLVFKRVVRIKILTTKGLDWANWELELFKGRATKEKIVKLKGYTYNLENG